MKTVIELTRLPIDAEYLLRQIGSPTAGGEVLFLGTVRQWTDPSKVADNGLSETAWLVYEAYEEMALQQMHRLAEESRKQWPICGLAIVHRLGKVDPMEASVAIAVSCPHRKEAFEAARWLIDSVKSEVPIWKQEHSGSAPPRWVHPG